jgi:uncharacterized membrane protein
MLRDEYSLPSLSVPSPVIAAAFWTAIVLPFVYLPLLATGLNTTEAQLLFVVLVALNVVMVIVGHSHRPERS